MLLLGAGMLAGALAGVLWSRAGSMLLVALSLIWLYADVKPEGPLLWKVSEGRGLVVMDLWGVLGLLVAAVLLVRGPMRRSR